MNPKSIFPLSSIIKTEKISKIQSFRKLELFKLVVFVCLFFKNTAFFLFSENKANGTQLVNYRPR